MITHSRTVVTTSPTLVSSAGKADQTVCVQNEDASLTVYLGGRELSTVNYGYKLLPGQVFVVKMTVGEELYGVMASGSLAVNVIVKGY
jgi:hypothetical protein